MTKTECLTIRSVIYSHSFCSSLGKTTIPLEGLLEQGVTDSWFTVGKGSNATGEVHARIHFKPVIFSSILFTYPSSREISLKGLILKQLIGNRMPR